MRQAKIGLQILEFYCYLFYRFLWDIEYSTKMLRQQNDHFSNFCAGTRPNLIPDLNFPRSIQEQIQSLYLPVNLSLLQTPIVREAHTPVSTHSHLAPLWNVGLLNVLECSRIVYTAIIPEHDLGMLEFQEKNINKFFILLIIPEN